MPAIRHEQTPSNASDAARRRLLSRRAEPLFIAGWERVVFFHYELDPAWLQPQVPFALDLREGWAYVSLVSFTLRGMRLRFGGGLGRKVCAPIATHHFLNVRTYVRHDGEPGIYFLTEWLSSPLCVVLGPLTYGLPYRRGQMGYLEDKRSGTLEGRVRGSSGSECFHFRAGIKAGTPLQICSGGSLDEFLLERYTAFTCRREKGRYFRIWHPAWRQSSVEVDVLDEGLLKERWPWFAKARFVGANISPGAGDVWMGWPHGIQGFRN